MLENVAIGERDGTLPFYHLAPVDDFEAEGLPQWYDGIGSFKREHVLKHVEYIPDIADRLVCTDVPTSRSSRSVTNTAWSVSTSSTSTPRAPMTHAFTANNPVKECHFRIYLGDESPVTPAKTYRQYLIDSGQFVSLSRKIAKTPDVAKFSGQPTSIFGAMT